MNPVPAGRHRSGLGHVPSWGAGPSEEAPEIMSSLLSWNVPANKPRSAPEEKEPFGWRLLLQIKY